jgi:F-type H+-transporting ATPase subunit b
MKRLLFLAVLAAGLSLAQEPAGEKREAAAEHHEEGDKLAIWKWANFFILAGVLGWMASKSLPAFFSGRTAEIQAGIAEAQKLKQEAEARYADMEARLAKLGSDIETFQAKAKSEMEHEGQRIMAETAAHARKLESQAAAEIETAGKIARAKLKEYAADLSIDLAAKQIQGGMNATSGAGLIDTFLADLRAKGSKN